MNKAQVLVGLTFLAFCCITLTTSLNCYICDSSQGQNCSSPTNIQTCNATLAQSTVTYGLSYTNASFQQLNVSSSSFACVNDYITSPNSVPHYYLGCAYKNLEICSLGTRVPNSNRTCITCSGDKCNFRNPADRTMGSIFTVGTAAIALAFISKLLN
ncbi:uncharacterized protein [Eurosta solidaginis]|uniref:uncharacterized protein n=1 Tax=Eurosta solidaginis TaxID=178769 RepID=UPI003530DABF